MLTKIISAAFATLTLVSNSNTIQSAMTAVIISDATRSAASPRIVDLRRHRPSPLLRQLGLHQGLRLLSWRATSAMSLR
jgi:hypothetical protein